MNGLDLSNLRISKTLNLPGAQESRDFLLGYIKSYAGISIHKMPSLMFFQAESRRVKPETHIYVTYTDFCKDFRTRKNLITLGKHDLHRAKHKLLTNSFGFLLRQVNCNQL